MKKFIFIQLIFLCSIASKAQENTNASGGDASSGSGSVSYTIGEAAYQHYSNASNIIIEGVQQPVINNALPVSLLYFSASLGNNRTVDIKWTTVLEINSDYFIVERSIDGSNFTDLKTVPAAGNSSSRLDYSIIDINPFDGYNYYRLKQVDRDGKIAFSRIEKVYIGNNKAPIIVYPNPTPDIVYIKVNATLQKELAYQLYDAQGKLINKAKITLNTTELSLGKLPMGTYILHITEENRSVQSFKLIKVR